MHSLSLSLESKGWNRYIRGEGEVCCTFAVLSKPLSCPSGDDDIKEERRKKMRRKRRTEEGQRVSEDSGRWPARNVDFSQPIPTFLLRYCPPLRGTYPAGLRRDLSKASLLRYSAGVRALKYGHFYFARPYARFPLCHADHFRDKAPFRGIAIRSDATFSPQKRARRDINWANSEVINWSAEFHLNLIHSGTKAPSSKPVWVIVSRFFADGGYSRGHCCARSVCCNGEYGFRRRNSIDVIGGNIYHVFEKVLKVCFRIFSKYC